MTRRALLLSVVCTLRVTIRVEAAARVSVLVIGDAPRIRDGYAMGSGEVRRMVALLGGTWDPTAVRVGHDVPATVLTGADAALLLSADPLAMKIATSVAGRPIVSAFHLPDDAGANVFTVRASQAARERAKSIWLQRHPDEAGVDAVEWHDALEKFGAREVNERFAASGFEWPDTELWAGWMAVKIVGDALVRERQRPLTPARLLSLAFDGHKGVPLRFDPLDRHLVQPLHVVSSRGALLGTVDPQVGPE
jgi:hypothetical protein